MQRDLATLDNLLAHAEWMRGLARRLLGNQDEADDVVQEAWLSALRAPIDRGRTLRPFIATVILNLVRSRARSRVRSRARERLFPAPEAAPGADDLLDQRQTERQLAQLVLALDEPFRRTILQRFHAGQTAAQIARDEGIPEGTVRWRLKRGLDQLRRDFAEDDSGGTRALGALLPIAGLPALPRVPPLPAPPASVPVPVPPPLPAAPWLGSAALLKTKIIITAVGAAAAMGGVAVTVHRPAHRSRAIAPTHIASRVMAEATPVMAPVLVPEPALPAGPLALAPQSFPPPDRATLAAAVPPPTPLVGITGVVRDSRGDAAARVPVTLRTLSGSGAADRTTTTDGAGRFVYQLQPRSRVLLTAELQGEPAARLEIEVPSRSAITYGETASRASTANTFATIEVALGASPRQSHGRSALPRPRPALDQPMSRWCCHEAFLDGDMVYGRTCLKFEDTNHANQSGCELYGLKTQVSCHRYTEGGLSTGDLSRTERLGCDGRLL
jgi:RNA polymerase sigma-70 factor (ECF subfamily)